MRKRLIDLMERHKWLVDIRQQESEQSRELQQEVETMLEKNRLYINIVKIVRESHMRPDLFRALAELELIGEPLQTTSRTSLRFSPGSSPDLT